jgi:Flp pilus assembly protein TadG
VGIFAKDGGIGARLRRYLRDRRGNIAALTALLVVPIVGVMGMATEAGNWYLIQRAEQNAADSAVLAAAQNGIINSGGTTYITEGLAVASKLGFTNGANSTTVTPVNGQTCPAPLVGSICYKVTISRDVTVSLTRIVGYDGTNGSGAQTIVASAIAGPVDTPISDCITSLGTGPDSYRVDGGPSVDLSGCTIQANGDGKCSGASADGNVSYFFIAGSNSGCNPTGTSGPSPTISDPFTSAYPPSNIPANNCASPASATSYWQESGNYGGGGGGGGGKGGGKGGGGAGPPQPPGNNWTGTVAAPGHIYCGDVKLSANTTLSGSGTIVIENGMLDLNGYTLTGTGVTLIFTGPTIAGFSPSHTPPASGTLDISAPTSGTWSGVAIYQDPALTSGVDWTSSGSALNWNITGLIYMPNSNVLFSGTINKATGGQDCFTMVDKAFRVNGNVRLTEHQTGCAAAGLLPPTSNLQRAVLVQ